MTTDRTRGLRLLAGALGLVALMTLVAPDLDVPPRQWVDLTVGEQGTIRDIAVTVTSVETSASLTVRDTELTSTGVFVVVDVVADALVDPVSFQRVQLETRDADRYEPRSEWISAQPPLTQPGFTSRGTWIFEVPYGGARGAHLLVESEPREFDGYDRGLRVDLGLDGSPPKPGALEPRDASTWVTR
jgi:hypothetical protein